MRIRGIGTAKLVAKWVRTTFGRPGALILGYHRIADTDWDPQQLCVSPAHFKEQLEALTRLGRPVSLQQFVSDLANGSDISRSVVMTFDDGYLDTSQVAAPLLEKYAVPATVFVPTGMIGKTFWWCEIQDIVDELPDPPQQVEFEVDNHRFQWKNTHTPPNDRAALIHALCAYFRLLSAQQISEALLRLRSIFNLVSPVEPPVRAMTADEIAELTRSDLIDVGSHTVSHASLNSLSAGEQREQLRESKAELEEIVGRRVKSFAYPNGAVSAGAPKLLNDMGFSCGITSLVKPVAPRCNPYLLPRPFVGDWDGEQFSSWLKRWLR